MHTRHVPFEVGTATGARTFKVKGKEYLLVTSWKSFSIYDLKDPLNPALVGTPTPFGFKFENEDVSTNGRIMLFSEELPSNILHVWDIQNLAAPREIATLAGSGGHTHSCIFDCKYSLGRNGVIGENVSSRALVHLNLPGTAGENFTNWVVSQRSICRLSTTASSNVKVRLA